MKLKDMYVRLEGMDYTHLPGVGRGSKDIVAVVSILRTAMVSEPKYVEMSLRYYSTVMDVDGNKTAYMWNKEEDCRKNYERLRVKWEKFWGDEE